MDAVIVACNSLVIAFNNINLGRLNAAISTSDMSVAGAVLKDIQILSAVTDRDMHDVIAVGDAYYIAAGSTPQIIVLRRDDLQHIDSTASELWGIGVTRGM